MDNKQANSPKKRRRSGWMSIIGGDILGTEFLRRQVKLLVLVVLLTLFYIHNRYVVQQQMIEIDRLKHELAEVKYFALTRSSELMEQSRQSRIEEVLRQQGSELHTATQPPYMLE